MMKKYMTPSSMMFLLLTIVSTIMMILSSDTFIMWASMELNAMSFIPLMLSSENTRELEASTKYFLVQATSSMWVLATLMLLDYMKMEKVSSIEWLAILMLLVKLGAAPFHSWVPQVMDSMTWINCLLLSTWQKVGPLFLLSKIFLYSINSQITLIMIITLYTSLVGMAGGLSQTQLRPLIAYSSISHTSWLMSTMLIMQAYNLNQMMMFYFLMYSTILFMVLSPLINENKKSSFNLTSMIKPMPPMSNVLSMNLLSLAGLPPLLGFYPKLMILYFLSPEFPILAIFLLLGAIGSMFYYLKLTTFNLMATNPSLFSTINSMSMSVSPQLMLMGAMIAYSSYLSGS